MEKIFGVYGASGFGKEVMPLVKSIYSEEEYAFVFIDDSFSIPSQINNYPVMNFKAFVGDKSSEKRIVIAIANSSIRQKLYLECKAAGINIVSIKGSNVIEMDGCTIGEGAILSPFVTLTSNITIGKCFHANIYSYVAHDCKIGDYVTFAPGVKCNGNIIISDHAYIGTGAILRQGKPDSPLIIGERAVIGMGAVVTKDVMPGAVVVGNPAKPLIK